jgi:hypothetical protein
MKPLYALHVSPENILACENALGALRENLQELKQLSRLQPIPCSVSGVPYLITRPEDVDALIEELGSKIERYGDEHSKGNATVPSFSRAEAY